MPVEHFKSKDSCRRKREFVVQKPKRDSFLRTLANVHTCYGLRRSKERFQMGLLTAYFDESGIHKGDHWCIVAGFVGNDAQWQALAADWIPAIKPRNNLHLKDLRWNSSPQKIKTLLSIVGAIPRRYNLSPVMAAIRWSDYNSIVKGKVNEEFVTPYMFCAHLCMAVSLFEIVGSDDVYFIFDRQEGVRKQTMNKLRDVVYEKIGVDRRVKGIDFIERRSTVCLDPADCLAFTLHHQGIDSNSDKATFGASICGPKGSRGIHGGKVHPSQLRWMVRGRQARGMVPGGKQKFPTEAIEMLMTNPYWRGPTG